MDSNLALQVTVGSSARPQLSGWKRLLQATRLLVIVHKQLPFPKGNVTGYLASYAGCIISGCIISQGQRGVVMVHTCIHSNRNNPSCGPRDHGHSRVHNRVFREACLRQAAPAGSRLSGARQALSGFGCAFRWGADSAPLVAGRDPEYPPPTFDDHLGYESSDSPSWPQLSMLSFYTETFRLAMQPEPSPRSPGKPPTSGRLFIDLHNPMKLLVSRDSVLWMPTIFALGMATDHKSSLV